MIAPLDKALAHLRLLSPSGVDDSAYPLTINFHPDIDAGGATVIDLIVKNGAYRSQFETGTSSGGLTAFRGGDRWVWESRIFGSAYDDEEPELRPKYGALNYHHDPCGGSRRFGSCHFRVASHVRSRTTFCYPDSHWKPRDFAVDNVGDLVAMARSNSSKLEPILDNYIEAHIHGPVVVADDVDAIVLDPSFRGTDVERAAESLRCPVEWHDGFLLSLDRLAECEVFRGLEASTAISKIAEGGILTPAILGRSRGRNLDFQTAKWVWHCIAKFGRE